MLQYNVPHGKMTRGISVINAYKQLCPKDQITDENIRLVRILGWCCEIVSTFTGIIPKKIQKMQTIENIKFWKINRNQNNCYFYEQEKNQLLENKFVSKQMHGFLLLEDDIMDHSLTRRGQPCWYLQDNIGLLAINDGQLLEQMIFKLLYKYFGEKSYYLDLFETFHKVITSLTI